MRWIDKLERRFGRYGIPYLMNIILGGQLAAWVIIMLINSQVMYLLPLSRAELLHGQIWRVITFLFMPPMTTSMLSLAISLYFYWWIGNALERAWGDFRFMVYVIVGMLGALAACLLTGSADTSGIFLSMFFAYAWMWPNQQILLFFILPVKIKWLGWAAAAMWAFDFVTGSIPAKMSLVFGLAGFLVFFGKEMFDWCRDEIVSAKRRRDWNNKTNRFK